MSLQVAVLINTHPSPYSSLLPQNFTTAVKSSSPGSSVTFYDPIQSRQYPDPAKYDLIVLSGGTVDPMSNDEWVVQIRNWIRDMVRDNPKQKLMGICWGHQQLCVAFGGVVGGMESPEWGVTTVSLSAAGKKFFPKLGSSYQIHEFHRREVKTVAKGFIELGKGSQCFVNDQNTILSFQGHPELDVALAKGMLGASPAYMGISAGALGEIERSMEKGHDGEKLWERIVEWVKE